MEVQDSNPENNITCAQRSSPTRVLEHYLQQFDSDSLPDPSFSQLGHDPVTSSLHSNPYIDPPSFDQSDIREVPYTPLKRSFSSASLSPPNSIHRHAKHQAIGAEQDEFEDEIIEETRFMSFSDPLPTRRSEADFVVPNLVHLPAISKPHTFDDEDEIIKETRFTSSTDVPSATRSEPEFVIPQSDDLPIIPKPARSDDDEVIEETIFILSNDVPSVNRSDPDSAVPSLEQLLAIIALGGQPCYLSTTVAEDHITSEQFITPTLVKLAATLEIPKRFESRIEKQARVINAFERRFWQIDCTGLGWDEQLRYEAWAFLTDYIASGVAG
ncbi:Uu.00g114620.m01.CDS01 [Anthostomella pinea]|uniref:Uu.00g114620.m01.CDS01 n=1 Tax=Anthostomella pinea TaxID=933095 RepID=A0AAI8VFQ6_9PEZI|nr:Uu.00g114620.m01.CDS01 [Anthostomella pinea]